jgi:hypothetical protein
MTMKTNKPSYTVHFCGTMSNCGYSRAYADELLERLANDNRGSGIVGEIHEHTNGQTTVAAKRIA